jgi:hypothetical protein
MPMAASSHLRREPSEWPSPFKVNLSRTYYRQSIAGLPSTTENACEWTALPVSARFGQRLRLKCAPTVTPLGFPLPYQIVVQGRKPRARLLELFDAPSRRQRRGARASRAAGRDFEPCCPVLRRYFGEARPVATTIEAGLIDGRAKIKIEVSA